MFDSTRSARALSFFVVVSIALCAGSAAADEPGVSSEELAAVHRLLGSIDSSVSAESFAAVARDPAAALIALAQNPQVETQRRRSAAAALTHWPEERVWDCYVGLLADGTDARLRAQVLMSAAAAFDGRALDLITTFLSSDDVDLRRASLNAAKLVGVEAAPMLRERIDREADTLLRAEIERAVADLEALP